jgi:hypothetical protein
MKSDPGMEVTRRSYYNCTKCPAYCCSVYERVRLTWRDLNRLARHFEVDVETAKQRFTTTYRGERILRRKADPVFGQACRFLDGKSRQCTIYHARPLVCRDFPGRERCAYYDLLQFERNQQDDDTVVPLVQITFRNGDSS